MKIACTIVALAAAAMLKPKLATANCSDPGAGGELAVTSVGRSVLVPVGPHPVLDRTLVASASSLIVLDTETFNTLAVEPMTANIENTPNPVQIRPGQYAAFIAQQNGTVTSFDPEEGTARWNQSVSSGCEDDSVTATPAVHLPTFASPNFQANYPAGLVYVATRYGCSNTTGNRVYALNAQTGVIEWIFNIGGAVAMDAVLADPFLDIKNDRLYVATDRSSPTQDSLFAIDVITGHLAWSANIGRLWTAPVVRGDRMYVVTLFGEVKALNVADGSVIWSVANPLPTAVTTNMFTEFRAPYDGLIVVKDTGGNLWAVSDNGATGSVEWSQTGLEATSRVAIDPGTGKIYVGARGNEIYQLNLVDGSIEATRAVGELDDKATAGVPTLAFEDTDNDGSFDELRMIAGSSTGIVAKFCLPWAAEATPFAPTAGPPDPGVCKNDDQCGEGPNQCSNWACIDGVCVAKPAENGKQCDDRNQNTPVDKCDAGTCVGLSDCDLRPGSCLCKDDSGITVKRELLLATVPPKGCPTPPQRDLPEDWCAREIVTLSALNQCVAHSTNGRSIVTVRLFDQFRRPFTGALVSMQLSGGNGTPPNWYNPRDKDEVISDEIASIKNGGVVEADPTNPLARGTYYAMLGGVRGAEPSVEPFQIEIQVKKSADDFLCIDTASADRADIPPVEFFTSDVCELNSDDNEAGYMRIRVVDGAGDPVGGIPVIVGYAEDKTYFFRHYETFLTTPSSPDVENFQKTDEKGVVEFFDFGNNMNGPLDVTVDGKVTCVQDADAVITLGRLSPRCCVLFEQCTGQ